MNGRMYDPIVGRMLSPDNFVEDPTSLQSFNRYSYVMNNPLKYTDPTGMKKKRKQPKQSKAESSPMGVSGGESRAEEDEGGGEGSGGTGGIAVTYVSTATGQMWFSFFGSTVVYSFNGWSGSSSNAYQAGSGYRSGTLFRSDNAESSPRETLDMSNATACEGCGVLMNRPQPGRGFGLPFNPINFNLPIPSKNDLDNFINGMDLTATLTKIQIGIKLSQPLNIYQELRSTAPLWSRYSSIINPTFNNYTKLSSTQSVLGKIGYGIGVYNFFSIRSDVRNGKIDGNTGNWLQIDNAVNTFAPPIYTVPKAIGIEIGKRNEPAITDFVIWFSNFLSPLFKK